MHCATGWDVLYTHAYTRRQRARPWWSVGRLSCSGHPLQGVPCCPCHVPIPQCARASALHLTRAHAPATAAAAHDGDALALPFCLGTLHTQSSPLRFVSLRRVGGLVCLAQHLERAGLVAASTVGQRRAPASGIDLSCKCLYSLHASCANRAACGARPQRWPASRKGEVRFNTFASIAYWPAGGGAHQQVADHAGPCDHGAGGGAAQRARGPPHPLPRLTADVPAAGARRVCGPAQKCSCCRCAQSV